MSVSEMVKLRLMLSSMWSLERAFGMMAMFCCRAQRSKICAGLLFNFLAIARTA